MKNNTLRRILALAMSMTLFVTGCSNGTENKQEPEQVQNQQNESSEADTSQETPETESSGKVYKIGVTMKQNADTFVKKIADAISARGDELADVEILMQDAEGDVAAQLSQVEAFIAQNVDAIILNAMDAEGSSPAVVMAREAGIPIIECNTLTTNTDYDVYVGSDDVDAGKIQGDYVKSILPEDAKVCIMYGPIGQSPQIKRKEGIEQTLLNGTKIEVLQDQTANWKREDALALAEDWLTRYPDLKAIICQNDDMALGALQAVESEGKLDEVVVVGIDAIEDALTAVKDGKLNCTVFQDAVGQGAASVDAALSLAKGETVEKEIMIPFQLVTKDNADEFIK